MEKRRSLIPVYAVVCLAVMAASQLLLFYGPRLFLPYLPVHPLTGPLDARIPFSPPWVTVYFLSFPYWFGTVLWVCCQGKKTAYRTAAGYVLALVISAAAFLIWPGTMERPEILGNGFFENWMRFLYRVDSPTNLCPSLHVLLTYFCWRRTQSAGGIPQWYRIFSFVFVLLVCASVLLIKQHAVIDVFFGVLIGELALQCARVFRMERIGFAAEKRISRK
ncbi:MAG: hypothetical protein J6P31_01640 [Oscillospiraceae bacterium]|nr:hypothetical protein [Oscillospiraceae bacterium]